MNILSERVNGEAGAELRFEPCCLRRHYVACICDVDELLHGDRVEGEGYHHFSAVHAALQFAQPSDSANEIDSVIRAQIFDAQNFV